MGVAHSEVVITGSMLLSVSRVQYQCPRYATQWVICQEAGKLQTSM